MIQLTQEDYRSAALLIDHEHDQYRLSTEDWKQLNAILVMNLPMNDRVYYQRRDAMRALRIPPSP